MAAILLTRDNIGFLKVEARSLLPKVKSTHRTEALAFGLGRQTYASLLASLTASENDRPLLADLNGERLKTRLASLGYPDLDVDPVMALPRGMPDPIWISFPNTDQNRSNLWFYECRRRNIPYIFIKTRRKYVKLCWDCVTIDPHYEAHVRGKDGDNLVNQMFKAYQEIARRVPGKSLFFGSSFVGSVDHVLPELAAEMADRFFAMLYEPMAWRERTF